MTTIPLVDLGWQHERIAAEVQAGWAEVVSKGDYVGGAAVSAFESAFTALSGIAHCVGVANGTDAIELALRALDLPAGAGVAVPVNTFIATAEAVLRAGLRPVLVDVDADHLLMAPDALEAVAERCRAVVPVHLYGQLAPMTELSSVADAHGLRVVEDAAQAQLARQHGQAAGAWSAAAATSFYPGKNLGAYGDGGAVLTEDAAVAARVRSLATHGTAPGGDRYSHPEVGFNSRLDTLQAVVLSAKLQHLEAWNALRRTAAERYGGLLQGVDGITLPLTAPGNTHVWHLYVVRVPRRDDVLQALRAAGIAAGTHYPVPLHRQGALRNEPGAQGRFPVGEAAALEVLSLPLFPGITAEQQSRVVDALSSAVHRPSPTGSTPPGQERAAVGPVAGPAQRNEQLVHPRAVCDGSIGRGTRVWANAHVMAGARVGAECNVGEGVFLESGVRVGDRVTVKNGALLWDGVEVEDDVFVGPAVTFTNDLRPRSRRPAAVVRTVVRQGASIGAGAVVRCGIELGVHSMVAAGAVVTSDVPAHALVRGVPARAAGWVCRCGTSLDADLSCPACGQRHRVAGPGLEACAASRAPGPDDQDGDVGASAGVHTRATPGGHG